MKGIMFPGGTLLVYKDWYMKAQECPLVISDLQRVSETFVQFDTRVNLNNLLLQVYDKSSLWPLWSSMDLCLNEEFEN